MFQADHAATDINIYKIVHTGPKTQLGGLKLGKRISEYQGSLKEEVTKLPMPEARKVTNLEKCNWIVQEIPRLTTSGTRRQLSVPFRDFNVAQAPDYNSDMSERWDKGPQEGDRWHPEGASIRFTFTLPPGTYATILLREFMHSPLNHY